MLPVQAGPSVRCVSELRAVSRSLAIAPVFSRSQPSRSVSEHLVLSGLWFHGNSNYSQAGLPGECGGVGNQKDARLFDFPKNQTHFISAACCAVLSAIAVYLLRDHMHNLPTVVLILVPIALLLLNLLLLQALINRIEKQKLSKILKGGAL